MRIELHSLREIIYLFKNVFKRKMSMIFQEKTKPWTSFKKTSQQIWTPYKRTSQQPWT